MSLSVLSSRVAAGFHVRTSTKRFVFSDREDHDTNIVVGLNALPDLFQLVRGVFVDGVHSFRTIDRDEIKTGEVIAGPGHPIAWPCSGNDLPVPPKVLGPKTGFGFSDSDKSE